MFDEFSTAKHDSVQIPLSLATAESLLGYIVQHIMFLPQVVFNLISSFPFYPQDLL